MAKKRYDFVVFGGTGLQGRICARDLLQSGYSALLIGRDPSGIEDLLRYKQIGFKRVDLRKAPAIEKAIHESGAGVVVNCAELVFNIPIMRACLKTGRSCTDLGGLQQVTRQQFKLHGQFRKKGILNLTGCGSTPGIANVMAAYAGAKLDSIGTIALGFAWDSNIKQFVIPYSIQSIFDEFTQAPVVLRNGKFEKESRSKCWGTFEFREVGMQTVYCIVHSEVYTFAKYFKAKGIRNVDYMAGFPEHSIQVIRALMELGFSSSKEIEVAGGKISPIEFTSRILKRLPIPSGYEEVENLWVRIDGFKQGKATRTELNCIIRTLKGWESAGSNVDTGRTISIMSQMLLRGMIRQRGVYAPEAVIPQEPFFAELAKREMILYEDGRRIN